MNPTCKAVKDGDIYETLFVDGKVFEIRYGYYDEFERDSSEPVPVYPDLEKEPIYGASGKRIVTHMQTPCLHFASAYEKDSERCCGCCRFYRKNRWMIDVCEAEENSIDVNENN